MVEVGGASDVIESTSIADASVGTSLTGLTNPPAVFGVGLPVLGGAKGLLKCLPGRLVENKDDGV